MSDIPRAELEAMLDRAAERGAQRALHSLGLQDDGAANDVAELRSLLEVWRTAKVSIVKTAASMMTAFLLGALALGVGLKFWKGQ